MLSKPGFEKTSCETAARSCIIANFSIYVDDMYLSYKKLSQHPRVFRKLTGLSLGKFREILDLVSDDFDLAFPKIGRRRKISTHENRLVLILLYYRCYITHEFIGYFVDLDEANICRLFARIEPLITHIKKDHSCLLYTSPSPRD